MKKLFLCLFLVSALCISFSCSKDSSIKKEDLEGTWGLTHDEFTKKIDGEIVEQRNEDYNPFAPNSMYDTKLEIINTHDNYYLINGYYWDKKKAKWAYSDKTTWIIKGNRVYGDENEDKWFSLKLSSDTLTLEETSEEKKGDATVIQYTKSVLRKMGGLLE